MNGDIGRRQRLWSFLLDDACRSIVEQLRAVDQPFIMLKGATIASWLYDDPSRRSYSDLDILVPPDDEESVIELLQSLGYVPLLDPRTLETISPEEQPLQNATGITIDLHVTLKGLGVSPQEAWSILGESVTSWDWAGVEVPALGVTARTMHLALHLAQLGLVDSKAAEDLRLGLERLDGHTWVEAAELAKRLRAVDAFTAGLALVPQGRDVLARLHLPLVASREARMRASSNASRAAYLEHILQTWTWQQTCRRAGNHLFPSADWLRFMDPEGTRSSWGLLLARVRRPFHVLRGLIRALQERRSFDRDVKRD